MKLKGFTGTWPKTNDSESESEGFSITDLRYGMCKWPVTAGSPHRFCGDKTEAGKVYCAGHRKLAYAGAPRVPAAPFEKNYRPARRDAGLRASDGLLGDGPISKVPLLTTLIGGAPTAVGQEARFPTVED